MIDYLDRMLERLVLDRVGSDVAVSFEPPDKDWRTQRRPPDQDLLDLYLVELRENRELRSNQWVRTVVDGIPSERPTPRRIDCHYLATAWSRATPGPATSPVLDEHALLHRLCCALALAEPMVASAVFGAVPLPMGFPAELLEQALPVGLLPAEGYPRLAEWWGTMGEQPLKPVVHFTVTVPLTTPAVPLGPMVSTATLRLGPDRAADSRHQIGGTVRAASLPGADGGPGPVADIWVDLLGDRDTRLRLCRSDSDGRFRFGGLAGGDYRLRAALPDSAPVLLAVSVPSPTAGYDLLLG